MYSLLRILALALALIALTTAAVAQPAEPSAEDRATARNLMDVGDDKLKAGDLKGALVAYRGADAIMAVPTTAIEVGKVQAELGLLIEAADTLQRIARFPTRDDEPAPFTDAREQARVLMAQVAKRTPSIKVVLDGAPEGESPEVVINGKRIPAAAISLPRKVNPGKHTIKAQAGDYGAVSEVDVAEGEKRDVTLTLEAGVNAGISTGEPPQDEPDVQPEPSPDEEAETSGAQISALVWVGVAVGAAGIIVGAITGGLTLSKESSLQDSCPNKQCAPGDGEDDLDSSLTMAHISTVGFAVGGVGVALAIVGLLISDFGGSEEGGGEEAAGIQPWIGPTSAGLRGSF